jgi:hypothetical protein
MNQAAAQRSRDAIRRRGEIVSFRRGTTRADVPASFPRSAGGEPPLAPGITSGARVLVVSEFELEAADFPVPPRKGDLVFLGDALDKPTTIAAVDANHREYAGCFEVIITGV